jgi:hypothetical protein
MIRTLVVAATPAVVLCLLSSPDLERALGLASSTPF